MGDGVGRARDAFNKQAWRRAYDELCAAAVAEPLEVDDLERLASAAYLAGLSDESRSAWISAHEKCADVGDVARAVRCAFWLAFGLLNGGDLARGGGWVDRAQRLLDDRKIDCVELSGRAFSGQLNWLLHAASCRFRCSTRTSRGVR